MQKGIENALSMHKVYKYTREHLFTLFPILRLKFPRFQSLETSAHRRFFVNMLMISFLYLAIVHKLPTKYWARNRVQRYYIFLKCTRL